jgi:spore germination protein YaaH
MTRDRLLAAALIGMLLVASMVAAIASRPRGDASANEVLRWGYYVTWHPSSLVSLQANVGQLDVVSPYYYHLTPSGTIKSFAEANVLAWLRTTGVMIVPLIQNESRWDEFRTTIATPGKRQAIVDKLVQLVEDEGYDGIHIDFEGVNQTDKALLTDFMTRLSTAFHARNWLVTQAVIARSSDRPSEWGGAYDYAALGRLNDYVVVMAYDYTSVGSKTPGAAAPLWWVNDVVDYATSQMSPDKILLGIPLYGYDWNTKKGPPATAVSNPDAAALTLRTGAQSGYDDDDGAPWIKYKDVAGDDHEVWYENATSFDAKLEVLIDAQLGGFAVWRLGHEDPAIWSAIENLGSPATRIPPFDDTAERMYFAETGHSLAHGFLEYWQARGGLFRFGYPRTEEFTEYDPVVGQSYTVQYFERARFEYHPEYAGTEFAVLLGHIGRWALERRGIDPFAHPAEPLPGARYFPETQHNLGGVFLDYWERHGGLYSFGYPLTEEMVEVNPEDGQSYTVQYFERARFEHHPEHAGTEYEVLLGLLGNEMLRERGWIR